MSFTRALALSCGGLCALTSAVLAGPVQASEFRYWTYWTSTEKDWSFSALGPAFRPADESIIEGWRLAVTGVDATTPPRVEVPDVYDRACGNVEPQPGILRIAVVLDYGTPADAPSGESPPRLVITCTQVSEGATGFDALKSIAEIRSERGFVCGLSGYPATGCGRDAIETSPEQSPEPSPEPTPEPSTEIVVQPTTDPTPSQRESIGSASQPPQPSQPSQTPTASRSDILAPTSAAVTPTAQSSSGTGPLLTIVIAAGIIALGVLAWTRSRGRR